MSSKPSATVNFVAQDFAANDIENTGWQQAEVIKIDKLWNGQPASEKRHAEARQLWSDSSLYVRFDGQQFEPLVLNPNPDTSVKTMRLWERDVCEFFLAPDATDPRRYAEFEIAPTGEWLDLVVDWTRDEPRDWEYNSGVEAFARIGEDIVIMVMKIPWAAFDRKPAHAVAWPGNLFRQIGSGESRGYLAWSPTATEMPNFHVPEKFGKFVFVR